MKVFVFVFVSFFVSCYLSLSFGLCCIGAMSSLQHRHRVLESFNKILKYHLVCVSYTHTHTHTHTHRRALPHLYSSDVFLTTGCGPRPCFSSFGGHRYECESSSERLSFRLHTCNHLRFLPGQQPITVITFLTISLLANKVKWP